jgi:23S rRNA (uracil1939-C5)-methyltransferase
MQTGSVLTLDVEKPAAGGRMIARHQGRVVLVSGAIPGERVEARVTRVKGHVAFASVSAVLHSSPDRRSPEGDPACGGTVFAHVAYQRQLALKREIVADAFARLGRLPVPSDVRTHASPERGYRMRARLHVHETQVGFYREGTHALCAPRSTSQLSADAESIVDAVEQRLIDARLTRGRSLDLLENRSGDQRVVALDVEPGAADPAAEQTFVTPIDGCTGVAVTRGGRLVASRGRLSVWDDVALNITDGPPAAVTIRRSVGAFFQGNRFLLDTLIEAALAHLPPGPVTDLYAGCGLFGLAAAASGIGPVCCVEGDRAAIADLRANAAPFGTSVTVAGQSVEAYLRSREAPLAGTVIVDPPRTGLSPDTVAGLADSKATRLVYVSCDPATLARDARRLGDARFDVVALELFDLFPNTAHVESVVVFVRRTSGPSHVHSV